jgi:hypothetical protein
MVRLPQVPMVCFVSLLGLLPWTISPELDELTGAVVPTGIPQLWFTLFLHLAKFVRLLLFWGLSTVKNCGEQDSSPFLFLTLNGHRSQR